MGAIKTIVFIVLSLSPFSINGAPNRKKVLEGVLFDYLLSKFRKGRIRVSYRNVEKFKEREEVKFCVGRQTVLLYLLVTSLLFNLSINSKHALIGNLSLYQLTKFQWPRFTVS